MMLAVVVIALAVGLHAPHAIAQAKDQAKSQAKDQKKATKGKPVLTGPKHRYQCKVGPYEKQTRLVMETIRDKPVYLAYWSSNGPFHCSFESWPGDGRATWVDSSAGTVVNLISGTMLIQREKNKFVLHAREVDRMPYCGTFGLISGILTVPTPKGECTWQETTSEEAGQLRPQEAGESQAVQPQAVQPQALQPQASPPQ